MTDTPRLTEQEALDWLARKGTITMSLSALGLAWGGVPKSTVDRWVKGWLGLGVIIRDASTITFRSRDLSRAVDGLEVNPSGTSIVPLAEAVPSSRTMPSLRGTILQRDDEQPSHGTTSRGTTPSHDVVSRNGTTEKKPQKSRRPIVPDDRTTLSESRISAPEADRPIVSPMAVVPSWNDALRDDRETMPVPSHGTTPTASAWDDGVSTPSHPDPMSDRLNAALEAMSTSATPNRMPVPSFSTSALAKVTGSAPVAKVETHRAPEPRIRIEKRPAHPITWAIRTFVFGVIGLSIIMIAYHAATSSASSGFIWWTTLAMSIAISAAKPIFGTMAERFWAAGDFRHARIALFIAVGALCLDATLLYAFRGDAIQNQQASAKAAIELRHRIQGRLDGLLVEQKALASIPLFRVSGVAEIPATPEVVKAQIEALEAAKVCRWIQPKAKRNEAPPAPYRSRECEAQLAALNVDLRKAEANIQAAEQSARAITEKKAESEKTEKRLAELKTEIEGVETELIHANARANPDHGAGVTARGLNWIPAGVTGLFLAEELRPVEAAGVQTAQTWAFVLLIELIAVFGLGLANRFDRWL